MKLLGAAIALSTLLHGASSSETKRLRKRDVYRSAGGTVRDLADGRKVTDGRKLTEEDQRELQEQVGTLVVGSLSVPEVIFSIDNIPSVPGAPGPGGAPLVAQPISVMPVSSTPPPPPEGSPVPIAEPISVDGNGEGMLGPVLPNAGPPACPSTLDDTYQLDTESILYYALIPSSPPDANNGLLCARIETTQDAPTWMGFGISTDDKMPGSQAVIGTFDATTGNGGVSKYDLVGKYMPTEMTPSRQTLGDASIVQDDVGGKTVLRFTKLLVDGEGEIDIEEDGTNQFLFARGSSGALGYHGNNRGSFGLDFEGGVAAATTTDATTAAATTGAASTTEMVTTAAATTAAATTEMATTAAATTNATTTAMMTTTAMAEEEAPSCPKELESSMKLEQNSIMTTLYYALVPSSPPEANNGLFCARLEVEQDAPTWVGLAISPDGKMVGSTGILGVPGEKKDDEGNVKKYLLGGYSSALVAEMDEEYQTLMDAEITHDDKKGITTMSFAKYLVEVGEVPIEQEGTNNFLHALGSSTEIQYHGPTRMAFTLDFGAEEQASTTGATTTMVTTPAASEATTTAAASTAAATTTMVTTTAAPEATTTAAASTTTAVLEEEPYDPFLNMTGSMSMDYTEPSSGYECFCQGTGLTVPEDTEILLYEEESMTCGDALKSAVDAVEGDDMCSMLREFEPWCCPATLVDPCQFCINGVPDPSVIASVITEDDDDGQTITCATVVNLASVQEEGSEMCDDAKDFEAACCPAPTCEFCPGGLTSDPDYVIDPNDSQGTCAQALAFAPSIPASDAACGELKSKEWMCCAPVVTVPCDFCPESGITADPGTLIPDGSGFICENADLFAKTVEGGSSDCVSIQNKEFACCPAAVNVTCSFCADTGLTVDDDALIEEGGITCGAVQSIAGSMEGNTTDCADVQMAEAACCPVPEEVLPGTSDAPTESPTPSPKSVATPVIATNSPVETSKPTEPPVTAPTPRGPTDPSSAMAMGTSCLVASITVFLAGSQLF